MTCKLLPLYVFFFLLIGCKNTNEKEKKSPRIKSTIKIKSPLSNEIFYKKEMQKEKVNIERNGLSEMRYEIVSKEDIYNKHKLINVKF